KRAIVIAATLFVLGAAPLAQAQDRPSAPKADPAKLELARQVFTENGGADAFKTQMRTMFSGMSQAMKAKMPAGNQALAEAMIKDLGDAEVDMVPQRIDLS